ncbi:MAG: MBL fold metallo-hydrolase [Candidatus Lokiarchaeota archaeon]|nr:MBL fold metallo-hydrolase [Candidatus Lokiarchaeota archaeon]MBD3202529.1 MBL fold metallo-hydrolase [Candidatus Lokiarchaeota archaeon]
MNLNISEGLEEGSLTIKVLTSNSVISTLLTDEKFQGKVIQPQTNGSKLLAEHGLAILIEINNNNEKQSFLLDTGGPKSTIINNAKSLGVELSEIDKLVLSHGHVDHYGGFMEVLPKLKEGCEVILSPHAYEQNMILIPKADNDFYTPEDLSEKYRDLRKQDAFILEMKLPPLRKALVNKLVEENNLKLIEIDEPITLTPGLITSGPIEIFDKDEISKGFYLMKGRKEFLENTFRDEIALLINIKNEGLVIISGCGHAGIVNTIKHAKKITGIDTIYAVIGGFHKEWEAAEDIKTSIQYIMDLNPEIVCGMHCTGFEFNKYISDYDPYVNGIAGTEFHL